MQAADWIALVGIALSLVFGIFALHFSIAAKRLSEAANRRSEKEFLHATRLMWQLHGYVEHTDHVIMQLQEFRSGGPKVMLRLRVVGNSVATDIRVNFSYDPLNVIAQPTHWRTFHPEDSKTFLIDSGLGRHSFPLHSSDVTATVTWTDSFGEEQELLIPFTQITLDDYELQK